MTTEPATYRRGVTTLAEFRELIAEHGSIKSALATLPPAALIEVPAVVAPSLSAVPEPEPVKAKCAHPYESVVRTTRLVDRPARQHRILVITTGCIACDTELDVTRQRIWDRDATR